MSSVAVCMVATFSLIAAAFVLMDLIPAMNAFLGVEKLPSHRVRIMVGVVSGASFILPFVWYVTPWYPIATSQDPCIHATHAFTARNAAITSLLDRSGCGDVAKAMRHNPKRSRNEGMVGKAFSIASSMGMQYLKQQQQQLAADNDNELAADNEGAKMGEKEAPAQPPFLP